MEQLNNPFVIYGYKGAEYFYDRFFGVSGSAFIPL